MSVKLAIFEIHEWMLYEIKLISHHERHIHTYNYGALFGAKYHTKYLVVSSWKLNVTKMNDGYWRDINM
jgi:hypothetical protein